MQEERSTKALSTSVFDAHYEGEALIPAPAAAIFKHLDDPRRLSAHMNRRSWMMAGGRMVTAIDQGHGQQVGSHITMAGKVLGIRLHLDEIVVAYVPGQSKAWQTVGSPRLLVLGGYRLGFRLAERELDTALQVFIDYDLPGSFWGSILGRLFGCWYARWCVNSMLHDASLAFTHRG